MDTARILEPVLDGGIESIKFFNGRLLTAEDLEREQLSQREARRLLGAALGHGVIRGFGVRVARASTDPVLQIDAGLAMNRAGDPVHLPQDIVLELASTTLSTSTNVTPSSAARFHACEKVATSLYVVGNDLWILTAYPARGTRGRAPVSGLGNSSNACNAKYLVDGVRFRLVLVTGELAREHLSDAEAPRLRSRLAARCFGAGAALSHTIDPFGATPNTTLVDSLVERGVIDRCEVPLAVFHWRAGLGFRFVDQWSVRRRLAATSSNRRDAVDALWASSDAVRADAEALVHQFQEQLAELTLRNASAIRAKDHFTYLPAVGVMPIAGNPRRDGFSVQTFFEGWKTRPQVGTVPGGPPGYSAFTIIEASRVRALLAEGLLHPPLSEGSDEVIWIYQVRENLQATRTTASDVQPYVIFARGAVPYRGHANYDVSHWDYATFT